MIEKVISGGQTGADIGGLRAAKSVGIPTGGFMPMGFRTLDGFAPWMESEFGMVAIDTPSYAERTRLNVMQSDCTIRFAFDFKTGGERCTLSAIKKYAKPYIDFYVGVLDLSNTNKLVRWITDNDFKIINIAGNSEKRYAGMEDLVRRFLVPVFERVQFEGVLQIPEYSGGILPPPIGPNTLGYPVLGYCIHGVNLDHEFCEKGCKV